MDKFKIKHLMRIISLVAILIFFLPTFIVSCSDQTVSVSAVRLVGGVKYYGEYLINPQLWVLLLLALPVILLILWIANKATSLQMKNIITIVISAADIILWAVLSEKLSNWAEENLCGHSTTFWFGLNIVLLIIAIIIAIVMSILKISDEFSIRDIVARTDSEQLEAGFKNIAAGAASIAGGVAEIAKNAVDEDRWECPNCNEKMPGKAKFCSNCGEVRPPKPEPKLIEERTVQETELQQSTENEASLAKEPEFMFCEMCGSKLSPGTKFCGKCGNKVDE